MDSLDEAASALRPRLFAIYGTFNSDPTEPILGWGIELPEGGAVFRLIEKDSGVHLSDTAQRVFEAHQVIGDVRLKWLDD